MTEPTIHLHQQDLPPHIDLGNEIAFDAEMMGLRLLHDRLCLLQLRGRDTDIHLVQIHAGQKEAPILKALMEDEKRVKIAHYIRQDIACLKQWLGIEARNLYCTKIASKLTRTYTDRHGLKDLTREAIGVDISKQQQLSDWGSATLTPEQIAYAASDVLYLHRLMDYTKERLIRDGRLDMAQQCFDFLPTRVALDLAGWDAHDIFNHS